MGYWALWDLSPSPPITEVFLYSGVPVNPILFRLLRIGKLARTFRMVTMSNVLQNLQRLGRKGANVPAVAVDWEYK